MVGQVISHYRLIEKLGEGGMGEVYLAEDTKLKRKIALKFLHRNLTVDKEATQRFEREAQAAAALNHPNIVTIYEIDEFEGQIFLAMEYVEGKTLRQIISGSQLQIDDIGDITTQICKGLSKAHQAGIVHRDIKPENILINEDGRVKILDFGLAKLKGVSTLTKEKSTMGTVYYMSPEQASGGEVDFRTDIWSVGVVLYEMFTGQVPFKEEYELAILYSILNEEPTPVRQLRPNVPIELEQVVNKALAKNLSKRYPKINEMLGDLRLVRQDSVTQKPQKIMAKKKNLSKKLLLAVAAFIMMLILSKMFLFSGNNEVINSIAVLPMTNLSATPEKEYFADGMTDALITELSKISALRVISRQSVMRFKGSKNPLPRIAKELNVNAILEGATLLAGDRVRITAKLIHAKDDRFLWAESYERDLKDILTLHREVAQSIAGEIKVKIEPQEQARLSTPKSVNPKAYRFYLKGRFFWEKRTPEGMTKGMKYFQRTIKEDPNCALAYAGLADSYHLLASYGLLPEREAFPKAKEMALKALEIDENLAEAHNSLAAVKLLYDWDWKGAEKEFKRAIELNPNYVTGHLWYAISFTVKGKVDEATHELQRALELDPLSISVQNAIARQYYFAKEYDNAISQYHKVLELDSNYVFAHAFLGQAYLQNLRPEQAITAFRKAMALSGNSQPGIIAGLGYAYALLGQKDEAMQMLNKLKNLSDQKYVSPFYYALVNTGMGNRDQAFEWLEKAYVDRSEWMIYLNVEHFLDLIRDDARFSALVKKVGLAK